MTTATATAATAINYYDFCINTMREDIQLHLAQDLIAWIFRSIILHISVAQQY